MNQEKIDFSSLDPARDPERWDRMIQSVASKALEARSRPQTISEQMGRWIRPALAMAAALALVIWGGALFSNRTQSSTVQQKIDPAYVLSGWASSQERPSTSRIVQVLGGSHVQE